MIYTSGSTGRPKGVELTHANLANLVDWHVSAFGVRPTDRASQVASVGFDAAVWEIWPHLAAGATGALRRRGDPPVAPAAPRLARRPRRSPSASCPTVLAEQLIHLAWPAGTALRTLLTGADVLHRRPAGGLPFALVNNYGPTECTVVATSGAVDAGDRGRGRPVDRAADHQHDRAGPGRRAAPGRRRASRASCASPGRSSAAGTATTPSSPQAGSSPCTGDGGTRALRVYRTGDQVRLLENGEIAFLGRLDKQVKIRGFRIEPAEIVAAHRPFPGVAAPAPSSRPDVRRRPGRPAEPELVAYVVPADGAAAPTAADLRAFLAARLPEYMVPARFVGIDALPLTINGKLDEAALPAEAAGEPAARVRAIPPAQRRRLGRGADRRDGAGLLKLPAIEPAENIFLVGGHSMLAMQLVCAIRQAFGVKLALRQVFEAAHRRGPSAAEVARRTSADAAEADRDDAPRQRRRPPTTPSAR